MESQREVVEKGKDLLPVREPGQDYHKYFNAKEYNKMYYTNIEGHVGAHGAMMECVIRFYHKVFSQGVRGQRLLDVGSGPTIYQVLSACENFEEIYLSDYIEQNRQQLQCWLEASPDAFDWNHIIKYVCKLEENEVSWEEKAAKLRKRVRAVMHCDVRHDPPLDTDRAPFDCIISSFCLEAACTDEKNFIDAVTHLAKLLKPGGLLLTVVTTGREFYIVGKERFVFGFVMTEDLARHAMEVAGLVVTICESHSTPSMIKNSKADFTGFVNIAATKPQ
uniref:indolethylamine N-methyltransferase-like n=1 Tax=Myxine glutinosa TaxID=7769 RepID=UPI00358EA3B7